MNELLNELYSLRQDYTTKDLEKIIKLSNFIGNPQLDYPVVHIAGTNGKGSVCSLLSSILQENNYKVGLYTSPHILKFNERIKINGRCILDEEIEDIYASINDKASELGASFFDITTAIAFKYFSKKNVDIAIIETGLGGRLDSTNIVNPILSIITNISKDHTNILGKDLKDITKEKAGIIKKNIPVLVEDTNPHILEILLNEAEKKSSPLYVSYSFPPIRFLGYENNNMICSFDNFTNFTDFLTLPDSFLYTNADSDISLTKLSTELVGKHQVQNIKLVIYAAILISLHNFSVKKVSIDTAMKNVVKNTGLHFRIQNISSKLNIDKPVILDVAHNPSSICTLIDTLNATQPNKKWNVIFGAMSDKNIKQMLHYISHICNKLFIVRPQTERAAIPSDIEKKALEIGFNNIEISDISTACQTIKQQNVPYLICGSFFIMEEVIEALQLKGHFDM